jgi:hypothetical protein
MKKSGTLLLYTLSLFCFACLESDSTELSILPDSFQMLQDTLVKWENYMESSADGLWEDSSQYSFSLERIHTFGGEYHPDPPFYKPWFMGMIGDSILVVDDATQSIVCMDTSGTVLWEFGEAGEGPGYFAGIGQIDVCGDTIAVINNGLSFIELLNRDGTLLDRISIARPQDLVFIDHRRLLVFSKDQPEGDVHLFDIEADSIIRSFGNGEWEKYPGRGARYEVWGEFFPPDTVVYLSHFEKKLVFAYVSSGNSFITTFRDLPFQITPGRTSYDEQTNIRSDVEFPLYRSLFTGPHGQINVRVSNLMADGKMLGSTDCRNLPTVTVFDRFNHEGQYLDSYCIPDSAISDVFYNGDNYMLGIQHPTGTIFGYRVTTTCD